jgi:DNA topoisomerase IB
MKTLYEDDLIPGEKHKGKTIKQVAQIDPNHLHYLQSTSRNYCISDEVMENLDKYKQKRKPGDQTTAHSIMSTDQLSRGLLN